MNLCSFNPRCGGFDLGFAQAGHHVIWALNSDVETTDTYRRNFGETHICPKDIKMLTGDDVPTCDGFIGVPDPLPWATDEADGHANFRAYTSLLASQRPRFFAFCCLAPKDDRCETLYLWIRHLSTAGYCVHYQTVDSVGYRIPLSEQRLIVVGFRGDEYVDFGIPAPSTDEPISVAQAIADIDAEPHFYTTQQRIQPHPIVTNHDVMTGRLNSAREIAAEQPSPTLPTDLHEWPLRPSIPTLATSPHSPRRLSLRECARLKSFPDSFEFCYSDIATGYAMVSHSIPPRMAQALALSIAAALRTARSMHHVPVLVGYYKDMAHLDAILRNRLYYVRMGLRRGALYMPVGTVYPQYLLLHNAGQLRIYRLAPREPYYISGPRLRQMGFAPNDFHYLAFALESSDEVEIPGFSRLHFKPAGKGRDIALPYLLQLDIVV